MRVIDHHQSDRIPVLLELVQQLSRATEPAEVLRDYAAGMVKLRGKAGFISLSCRGLERGQYRITRLLTQDNLTDIHKADPWRRSESLPVHEGGLLGGIVAGGAPVVMTDLEVRDDPAIGNAAADYRSLIASPLFEHGEPLNWGIQLRREPDAFTVKHLEEMLLQGNLVGNTVRHVQTARQLRQANERIAHEMKRIAEIQRALLPSELPAIPGVRLAASYQTFDTAGGDYYHFHEVGSSPVHLVEPDGRWGLMVADVSGHGPAAATVMAMLVTVLMTYPGPEVTPTGVLQYANEHLCNKRIDSSFVTAFIGLYDSRRRTLTYSCAGHPPPLWRTSNGGNDTVVNKLDEAGSLPLGILTDVEYEEAAVELRPGDTLALYTDGITEAKSPDGEMFGVEGMEKAIRACSGEPQCLVDTLNNHLQRHQQSIRPQDDQTLVAMRVDG